MGARDIVIAAIPHRIGAAIDKHWVRPHCAQIFIHQCKHRVNITKARCAPDLRSCVGRLAQARIPGKRDAGTDGDKCEIGTGNIVGRLRQCCGKISRWKHRDCRRVHGYGQSSDQCPSCFRNVRHHK